MQLKPINSPSERTYYSLVMLSALIFLVLPFITTFNELLTAIVIKIQLYALIENLIVPFEARIVAGLVNSLFGVDAYVSQKSILLQYSDRNFIAYISWNCIGWQSLVLFAITCLTGLRGEYTLSSKIKVILIGLQGTLLLNIARILLIVTVAMFWGYLPSLIIHDYAGTVMILVWLIAFWHISYGHVLEPLRGTESEPDGS
jgi:exosortase/archaeosortase family protein